MATYDSAVYVDTWDGRESTQDANDRNAQIRYQMGQLENQAELDAWLTLTSFTPEEINAAMPQYATDDLYEARDLAYRNWVGDSSLDAATIAELDKYARADLGPMNVARLQGGMPDIQQYYNDLYNDPEKARAYLAQKTAPIDPNGPVIGGYHTTDGRYIAPTPATWPAPPPPSPGPGTGPGPGSAPAPSPNPWILQPTTPTSPQWQNRVTVGAAGNEMTGPGNAEYDSSLIESLRSSNPQRLSNNTGVSMTPNAQNAPSVNELDLSMYEGLAFSPERFETPAATMDDIKNWDAYTAYRDSAMTSDKKNKNVLGYWQWLDKQNAPDELDTSISEKIINTVNDTA